MKNIADQKSAVSWLNKVPEITLSFWIVKILSTTVGETVADFLAVDVGWGQAKTCIVMFSLLASALFFQIKSTRYTPWIYWLSVVLISVVVTQITDLLTDGLGVSLYWSTLGFSIILIASFVVWFCVEKTLSIHAITTSRRERFYWGTILSTFALGTAAGDLATEALGLGFSMGALAFGGSIALIYLVWRMGGNSVFTFWIAYILTRPFGAALGDFLTQSPSYGGLGFGALRTSALFLIVITFLVVLAERQTRVVRSSSTF